MNQHHSRRDFLKQLSAMSGSAAALPLMSGLLSMGEAAAQTVSCPDTRADYKALVCIYLAGGNDAYNTVMYNDASTARYKAVRPNIHSDAGKLALSGPTDTVALNGVLSSLITPYREGRMAIVANMGPLIKPTKRNASGNGFTEAAHDKLFSHNDQTSIWHTGELEGTKGSGGWGARLLLEAAEPSKYGSVGMDHAPAFNSYWLPGAPTGVVTFGASSKEGALRTASPFSELDPKMDPGRNFTDGTLTVAQLEKIISDGPTSTRPSGQKHLLELDYLRQSASALSSWKELIKDEHLKDLSPAAQAIIEAAKSVTIPVGKDVTRTEPNELAAQLAMVYRFIAARDLVGAKRQVFYVQLDGFDTHSGQVFVHQALMIKLNGALAMFDKLLGLDLNTSTGKSTRDQVTTFTASEFGRKLNENGDGTDHGWGGHHFVMGGLQINGYRPTTATVAGRSGIYGKLPSLQAHSSSTGLYPDEQLLPDGTMIPTVAVDQFGWQLGSWFGLCAAQLDNIFPYNKNFSASGINVNFLNTAV